MSLYIALCLMILIIIVNRSIPSSTIERDVTELSKLHKEFLDRSPHLPAIRAYEVRCRAVAECCPNEQENLHTIFSQSQFNDKCLSNGTQMAISSRSLSCILTLRQLIEITRDPIYEQY
jgi:hypothetical protein